MNKFFVLCLSLLIIVSCEGEKVVGKLGRRIVTRSPEIEAELTPTDSLRGSFLDGTWGVHCVEDSIIVFQLRDATGSCFRALNLKTHSYQDFLTLGRGPDEVVAGFFSKKRKENGRTLLDITAINEGLLLTIDLDETLQTGQTVIMSRKEIIPQATKSFYVGDRILSEVVNDIDMYSFKLYDPNDHEVQWMVQPYGEEEYLALFQPLFSSTVKIKPDGTKLSLSMLFFNGINIIEIEGEEHMGISVSKRNDDALILKRALSKKRLGERYYYMQHDVTDADIFALYYDCNTYENRDRKSSVIHVFSWEGKWKAAYHLNEPLISLIVSEDGRSLYGLTAEEILYKYDL